MIQQGKTSGKRWDKKVERTSAALETVAKVFYGDVFAGSYPLVWRAQRQAVFNAIAGNMRKTKHTHIPKPIFTSVGPLYHVADQGVYDPQRVFLIKNDGLEDAIRELVAEKELVSIK